MVCRPFDGVRLGGNYCPPTPVCPPTRFQPRFQPPRQQCYPPTPRCDTGGFYNGNFNNFGGNYNSFLPQQPYYPPQPYYAQQSYCAPSGEYLDYLTTRSLLRFNTNIALIQGGFGLANTGLGILSQWLGNRSAQPAPAPAAPAKKEEPPKTEEAPKTGEKPQTEDTKA